MEFGVGSSSVGVVEGDLQFNKRSEIVDGKGKEVEELGSTSPKCEGPLSPGSVKKGVGLKKWRRIPRDASRRASSSSTNTGKVVIEELPDPVVNPTKRGSVYADRQRKGDASFSPPSPVVGGVGDLSNGQGKTYASTVIDDVKINYEIPLVAGFPHDKSLGGKSLPQSVNRGKARIQAKKLRGDGVKHDKHGSSNGVQVETTTHPDGENDEEVSGSINQAGDEIKHDPGVDNKGESENFVPEVNNIKNENHGPVADEDPFAEVICELQAVQEALGKELFMLREITRDAEDSVSYTAPELSDMGKEIISEDFPSPGFKQSSSENVETMDLQNRNKDTGSEADDDLLNKKIEAEVVHTVITGTVAELRSLSFTQITASEQQKAQPPHITERYDQHVDTENNLEKEAQTIARSDLKTVYKYASYFVIQLLMLVLMIALVSTSSSRHSAKIVPT